MSINAIVNQIIERRTCKQVICDYLESEGLGCVNYGKAYTFGTGGYRVLDVSFRVSNAMVEIDIEIDRVHSIHKNIVHIGMKPNDVIQTMEKAVSNIINNLFDIDDAMQDL